MQLTIRLRYHTVLPKQLQAHTVRNEIRLFRFRDAARVRLEIGLRRYGFAVPPLDKIGALLTGVVHLVGEIDLALD